MSNEINDFLSGGGLSFKFEELNDVVEGVIEDLAVKPQTNMETGEALTWPDGNPKKQLVVTLVTDLRESDDDDGTRKIYAKGGNYTAKTGSGKAMKEAIVDALKQAKAKELEVGGRLKVGYTGIGQKTKAAYSAPKLYTAKYTAPAAPAVSESDLDF
jgi:hypothetical protein